MNDNLTYWGFTSLVMLCFFATSGDWIALTLFIPAYYCFWVKINECR